MLFILLRTAPLQLRVQFYTLEGNFESFMFHPVAIYFYPASLHLTSVLPRKLFQTFKHCPERTVFSKPTILLYKAHDKNKVTA